MFLQISALGTFVLWDMEGIDVASIKIGFSMTDIQIYKAIMKDTTRPLTRIFRQ